MPGKYLTRYKLPITSFQQAVTYTDVTETTHHCNSVHRSWSGDYSSYCRRSIHLMPRHQS